MGKNNSTNQYLPTYKENFKGDPRWVTKESAHYTFYYFKWSEAEKDINIIATTQEDSFKKVMSLLNVEPLKEKIQYYFYPDKKTKKELMGDDGYAQAVHKDFTIHVLYTEEHKPIGEHEDTHLLSLSLGLATGFFAEGLAECLSWDRIVLGKTKYQWLEEGRKKILPIAKIITHQDWMNTPDSDFMYYYSFAGFFVKKLINQFGINTFKDFYKSINRNMEYEDIDIIFAKYFKSGLITFNKSLSITSS